MFSKGRIGAGFNPMHFLRFVQGLFAIITMALYGSLSSYIAAFDVATPSRLAYPIFVSVFTILLAIPYLTLTPVYCPRIANKFACLGMETLTTILWMAAWAGSVAYLNSLSTCNGRACHIARAGTAFAIFEFLFFFATLYFAASFCWASKGIQQGSRRMFDAWGNNSGSGDGTMSEIKISRPLEHTFVSSNSAYTMQSPLPPQPVAIDDDDHRHHQQRLGAVSEQKRAPPPVTPEHAIIRPYSGSNV